MARQRKLNPSSEPPAAKNLAATRQPARKSPTGAPLGQKPAPAAILSRVKSSVTGLTPPQEAFAVAVALGASLSDAYRGAFPRSVSWKPVTLHAEASRLAAEPHVSARVQRLLASAAAANEVDIALVLKQYLARLHADPRELTEIRVIPCRHCYGRAHRYQFTDGELEDARDKHEERRAALIERDRPDIGPMNEKGGGGYTVLRDPNPECPTCGGAGTNRVMLKDSRTYSPAALTLFGGVKQTKDGIEVKLTDRVDVLGHVARHVGFFEADSASTASVTINLVELDAIYADALERARSQEAGAKGRVDRLRTSGVKL